MGDLERRESIGFILQTLSGLDELKRWLHWKCWHGADLGKQDSSSSGSSLELVPCWVKCISIKLHRFDRNLLDSHHSSTQPGGNALLCLTTRWDSLSISMAMITFFPPPPDKATENVREDPCGSCLRKPSRVEVQGNLLLNGWRRSEPIQMLLLFGSWVSCVWLWGSGRMIFKWLEVQPGPLRISRITYQKPDYVNIIRSIRIRVRVRANYSTKRSIGHVSCDLFKN